MKVLIISHNCFSKTHNNGKTLSAIFSAFKPDELCQLFFTRIGPLDYERCENYYYISNRDALDSIVKRKRCGQVLCQQHGDEKKSGERDVGFSVKRTAYSKFFRSILMLTAAWYRGGLNRWIEEQRPDLIFYVGGDSFFSHTIAVSLSRRLSLPLVTYFTDDYVLNTTNNIYNWFLKRIYKKTILRSTKLYAIGVQMAEDYSLYYGRTFKPIMNIVDIHSRGNVELLGGDTISINYFGGLHLGRAREIIRFARFYDSMVRNNVNKRCVINVYSFATPSLIEKKEMEGLDIIVNPGVVGADLVDKMKNSTILLHVESVEKEYHKLTKLSVSTKIPEYMSLAKPIIAFGPIDVASFRVISDADSSLVISDDENADRMIEQAERIIGILNSEEKLQQISSNNYEYVKTHFDKNIVSEQFRNDIVAICKC